MGSIIALFIEGILSFFSPCVLPLIPLYMGYLTQSAKTVGEDGIISYNKTKVFFTTLSFVLGISTVFFVIALSVASFSNAFSKYSSLFSLFSGFLLIVFALISLNVINVPFLDKEIKLPFNIDLNKMNYLTAFIFGFLFSFSWTPCIGPLLASAIVKAASASSRMMGISYILVYAFGFILMFLLLGLFTELVLEMIKKNQWVIKKTGLVAGLIILGLGINTIYFSSKEIISLIDNKEVVTSNESVLDIEKYNFTLKDKNGNNVSLIDYKGKVVLFTFYGTWCYYCNLELPLLEELYQENEDIEVFLIATPEDGREGDIESVIKYMDEKGYTLPVLFDEGSVVKMMYGVSGYPTTFVYKADGSLLGYLPGYVEKNVLEEVVKNAE